MLINAQPHKDEEKTSSPSTTALEEDSSSSSGGSEPVLQIATATTPEQVQEETLPSISRPVDKFWITNELFIVKETTKSKSENNISTSNSGVTLEKIKYNCKILQKHCQECSCATPRLHIYLLSKHQCDKKCVMSSNASALHVDETSRLDMNSGQELSFDSDSEQNLSELSINTEFVVVNDETIKESLVSHLPTNKQSVHLDSKEKMKVLKQKNERNSLCDSPDSEITDEDKQVVESNTVKRLILAKSKRPRKRKCKRKRPNKCLEEKCKFQKLDNTNFSPINFISLADKMKEEDIEFSDGMKQNGIAVDDFQKELLKIRESASKTTATKVSKTSSRSLSDVWRDFQSLVKDEPDSEQFNTTELMLNCLDSQKKDNNFPEKVDSPKRSKKSVNDSATEDYGVANIVAPMKMKISFNLFKRKEKQESRESSEEPEEIHIKTENEEITKKNPSAMPDVSNNNTKSEDTFCPKIASSYSERPESSNEDDIDNDEMVFEEDPVHTIMLKCLKCEVTFDTKDKLKEHLEEYVANGIFVCIFCQKLFKDRTNMKRHMRVHTGEKPYKCTICNKQFSLPGNFKKHRDIHSSFRTDPCEVCGRTFKRREHLIKHNRIHTGEKPYECSLCPSAFTARYSLHIHMNNHLGRKPYECSFCSKCFSDSSTMRKHERVHTGERPFQCPICQKTFAESGTLNGHMTTHKDDRPFMCELCKQAFKTSSALRQHYKVHAGIRSFSCKFCGNKFMQKYNLTTHERIHTGEKPFTCSHCDRRFRSKSCMQKHIQQIHGGDKERRFQCNQCTRKFFRSSHLKRHLDSHLGVKEFECKLCSKRFTSKASLSSHTQTFHTVGARKFPCHKCGKIFKRKIYVSTHKCSNVYTQEMAEEEESQDSDLTIKEECEEEEFLQ